MLFRSVRGSRSSNNSSALQVPLRLGYRVFLPDIGFLLKKAATPYQVSFQQKADAKAPAGRVLLD